MISGRNVVFFCEICNPYSRAMNKILEKLLAPKEVSAYQENSLRNQELLDFLIKKRVVLDIDWAGESEKTEIGSFLQYRLNQFENGLQLDLYEVYRLLEQEEMERGDGVPFILSYYEPVLKKAGFAIHLVGLMTDTYYLVLLPELFAKELKKIKDPFWKFSPFGSTSGEVLYTVNCSCGSMNVWQLKRHEPAPANDHCQDCGKMLFDQGGNALLPVEKDYI